MYQIDNATAATSQPASTPAGTAGFFTDGNPATNLPATILPAEWLNSVMMELVNLVLAGGLTPQKNSFSQVTSAVKAIGRQRVILTDTGVANAYAATNTPAYVVGTWVDGVVQFVKIANANTGASTYSPDGLTPIPIYGLNLTPLQGGELRANCVATLVKATIAGVNGGNPVAVLLHCYGAPLQVSAPSQGNHAVNRAAGDARWAALSGLATQAFDVGPPTNGASAVNLNEFFASLTSNGCVKIPVIAGGVKRTLIIQWGSLAAVPAGSGAGWTFPLAFPNAYLGGVAGFTNSGGISGSAAGGIGLATLTGVTLFNNGSSGASQISVIVLGW